MTRNTERTHCRRCPSILGPYVGPATGTILWLDVDAETTDSLFYCHAGSLRHQPVRFHG